MKSEDNAPRQTGGVRYAGLTGGSTSQHDVSGQFHVPVVLGEFFVTLN